MQINEDVQMINRQDDFKDDEYAPEPTLHSIQESNEFCVVIVYSTIATKKNSVTEAAMQAYFTAKKADFITEQFAKKHVIAFQLISCHSQFDISDIETDVQIADYFKTVISANNNNNQQKPFISLMKGHVFKLKNAIPLSKAHTAGITKLTIDDITSILADDTIAKRVFADNEIDLNLVRRWCLKRVTATELTGITNGLKKFQFEPKVQPLCLPTHLVKKKFILLYLYHKNIIIIIIIG